MEAAAKFPVKLSFERSVTNGNVFAGEHFKNIFKYTFSVCFRFIFNTVPAQFINEETLKNVDLSALIIDIASSPGGVDYDAAQRLGISALHCLGLPGKYAPASSARHLKQFIESKLYLS